MNRKNLVVTLCAAISFIAGCISSVFGIIPLSVLFYTADSALLIWLYILRLNEQEEEDAEGDMLVERLRETEQDKIELKQRIYALEKELEERLVDFDKSHKEATGKEDELVKRIEELENRPALEACEAFLPPIDDGQADNETIDIIEVARETVEELKSFAKEAGINTVITSEADALLVKGNTSRMRIMFRNIIDNSIKYMAKAGALIITISSIGDDIFIVCKDNGNGLPEDETSHIFELNFQGSNRISGNGLGLTQAKAIVDYYGGTIFAKSNEGKGMGIYIQLPTT